MQIYLAPLQGLTDWIFREAFSEHIGRFDKTFSPFIRVQHGEFYRPSQCNDILPENNVLQHSPEVARLMIGRGILQNPFLLAEIRHEILSKEEKSTMLRNFHVAIIEHCSKKYSGDLHFLNRLEELWSYHYLYFEDGRKIYKWVKKCTSLSKYEAVVFKVMNEI